MDQKNRKISRSFWWKLGVGILCIIGFLFLLIRVNQFEKTPLLSTEGQSYEKAIVTAITKDNLAEDGNRYGTQEVIVQIKSGEYAGQEFDAINPSGSLFGAECELGTRVIVIVSANGDDAVVTVYSQDRTRAIYLFVLLFAAVVCLIGGKKGVMAVASLAFTLIIMVYLMFPLIYQGVSPILITVIVAVLSTVVTLGLLGGFLIVLASPILLHLVELTTIAKSYLRTMLFINAAYVLTKALNTMLNNGIFCAGGDTRFGLICDTIDMWCFSVPLGFICAFLLKLPPMTVYFILCLDELAKLPFAYHHFKTNKWVKNITRKTEEMHYDNG